MTAEEIVARALVASFGLSWDCICREEAADAREQARAVLAALEGAGLVVVPKEPTLAMIQAAVRAQDAARALGFAGVHDIDVYRAMLAASPALDVQETQG